MRSQVQQLMAQVAPQAPNLTGVPMIDGLIVSSPLAGILYLWVRSVQREKEQMAREANEARTRLVELAESQAASNVTVAERLSAIERHLALRNGQ